MRASHDKSGRPEDLNRSTSSNPLIKPPVLRKPKTNSAYFNESRPAIPTVEEVVLEAREFRALLDDLELFVVEPRSFLNHVDDSFILRGIQILMPKYFLASKEEHKNHRKSKELVNSPFPYE